VPGRDKKLRIPNWMKKKYDYVRSNLGCMLRDGVAQELSAGLVPGSDKNNDYDSRSVLAWSAATDRPSRKDGKRKNRRDFFIISFGRQLHGKGESWNGVLKFLEPGGALSKALEKAPYNTRIPNIDTVIWLDGGSSTQSCYKYQYQHKLVEPATRYTQWGTRWVSDVVGAWTCEFWYKPK